MIVRCENKFASRTCGSVRSSLSAPARLATVGSEAAGTMFLHRQDEVTTVRWSPQPPASRWSERQGWMTRSTQVNCHRHRKLPRAKDADRLKPKGNAASVPPTVIRSTRTITAVGVEAGANSFVSLQSNIENPTSRLPVKAGASARGAEGMTGMGCWKKRMPFDNGTDRSCNITPPCKRADFQRVVRDEKAGGTGAGGNGK
jgi:hypothetical protein